MGIGCPRRRHFVRLGWSPHQQVVGKHFDEHFAHPRGQHFVGGRITVMHILSIILISSKKINNKQFSQIIIFEFLNTLNILHKLANVITVTMTESVTSTIVNSKYLPIRGMTKLVEGIISTAQNNEKYIKCLLFAF